MLQRMLVEFCELRGNCFPSCATDLASADCWLGALLLLTAGSGLGARYNVPIDMLKRMLVAWQHFCRVVLLRVLNGSRKEGRNTAVEWSNSAHCLKKSENVILLSAAGACWRRFFRVFSFFAILHAVSVTEILIVVRKD